MQKENWTINIDELFFYILEKWKLVLITIGVFCALFAGIYYFNFQTKEMAQEGIEQVNNQYVYEQFTNNEEYMESSILMKMDPNAIFQKVLTVYAPEKEEEVEGFLTSDVWTADVPADFLNGIDVVYLKEVVKVERISEKDYIQITVEYFTEEGCKELGDYIESKVLEYGPNVMVKSFDVTKIARGELLSYQYAQYNMYNNLRTTNERENPAAMVTIEKNLAFYLIVGVCLGAVLAVVLIVLEYILSKKVQNISELQSRYSCTILGQAEESQKCCFFVDQWIYQWKNRVLRSLIPTINTDAFYANMEMEGVGTEVLVINMTGAKIELKNDKVLDYGKLLEGGFYQEFLQTQKIILAVKIRQTYYQDISKIVELSSNKMKEIVGVIVY